MGLIKICQEVLEKHDLGYIKVSFTNDERYKMYFDIKDKGIRLNENILREESSSYVMEFEDYVRIIFCHELGHYLDNELEQIHKSASDCFELLKKDPFSENKTKLLEIIKNNKIKAEENAWIIAKGLIGSSLQYNFNLVKNDSLKQSKEIAELEKQKMILTIKNAQAEINSNN